MMGGLERQSKDLYLGKNTVIMFQEHHGKDELKKPYFSQFYFVWCSQNCFKPWIRFDRNKVVQRSNQYGQAGESKKAQGIEIVACTHGKRERGLEVNCRSLHTKILCLDYYLYFFD